MGNDTIPLAILRYAHRPHNELVSILARSNQQIEQAKALVDAPDDDTQQRALAVLADMREALEEVEGRVQDLVHVQVVDYKIGLNWSAIALAGIALLCVAC